MPEEIIAKSDGYGNRKEWEQSGDREDSSGLCYKPHWYYLT